MSKKRETDFGRRSYVSEGVVFRAATTYDGKASKKGVGNLLAITLSEEGF